jgi:iron complex transport system substrate-binding protein
MPAFHVRPGPRRIVCLTEEPTETLYALGEQARIVGISAYTVRPPEAKRDKPVVSAFVDGSVSKIQALEPDLVIGFSDVQAELARKLISANLNVWIANHRSVREILQYILDLGGLVGAGARARALVDGLAARLEETSARTSARARRPRVYFEEWDEPMLTAIHWVSELIEIAGGRDLFSERSTGRKAEQRVVTAEEVIAADPELILGSWCGKPFDRRSLCERPGFDALAAVRTGAVHEIDSAIILQPGPAALTAGLDRLEALIAALPGVTDG